jgi:hypothetical protein
MNDGNTAHPPTGPAASGSLPGAGPAPGRPRLASQRWTGPLVIVGVAAVLAWQSWGCWPDVLVDFGRELYVPWQLVEGKTLYADIAHLSGPLSPYVNAFWFRLLGVGLTSLVIGNLLLLAVHVTLFYVLLVRVGGRLAAACACLVWLTVFGFGQLISVGNYNFVCPYAHEMTHGLLLGTAAVAGLSASHRSGRLWPLAGAGLALGLAFLTKVEIFLPAAAAVAVGLALSGPVRPEFRRPGLRPALVCLISALVPVVLAFALLSLAMPAGQALQSTARSWTILFQSDVSSLPFYRQGMGLDDPVGQLAAIAGWIGAYGCAFAPVALAGLALRKPGKHRSYLAVLISLSIAAVLAWCMDDIEWRRLALPWPVFVAAISVIGAVRAMRRRAPDHETRARSVLICMLSVFALGLLGKMVLNTRLYHYGFALAMPATLLIVVAMAQWIPAWVANRGGCAWVVRGAAMAALAVAVFVHARRSYEVYQTKTFVVSSGADAFRADARGDAVATMLEEIRRVVPHDATLAVFPEGVMINYLARRANPTPHLNFLPLELMVYGESEILASLQADAPDYVVLAHKDTSEYGVRFFGQGYGQRLFAWIRDHYRPISLVGAAPLQSDDFGLLLLGRSDP